MAFHSGCRARANAQWQVAVALGMLLAAAPACSLVAPKPHRDRVIWRRAIVSPGTDLAGWRGIPATDGRYVCIQTDTGVSAIDPADGRIVLGDFFGSSILALNRFTNTKAWEGFGDPTHFGPDYGQQLVGDAAFIASNDDFPTSGFAIVGTRAVATGTKSAYGIDCS